MTSRETLECRIYMAEDAMYRRSDELNELESRLRDLTAAVHVALCESGQTLLEVKTGRIVRAVEIFEAGTDLNQIRAEAQRITSLKGLINGFERAITESAEMPDPGHPTVRFASILPPRADDPPRPGSSWLRTGGPARFGTCHRFANHAHDHLEHAPHFASDLKVLPGGHHQGPDL
jgi:hypothetical protein